MADGEKKVGEKKKKNGGIFTTIKTLYSFADGVDIQLMLIGLLFSLVQAILPPFTWWVMGDFYTEAITLTKLFEQTVNVNKNSDSVQFLEPDFNTTLDEARKNVEIKAMPVFITMLCMSLSLFVAAFFQRLAWEVSGIRQIFRTKRAYINKLLNMDVAWLESRHSGQVASMLHDRADSIYHGIADHFPMVVFTICYLIVATGTCFVISWDVTLVLLMIFPILIISRIIFSKWFMKTTEDEVKLQNKITNLVQETFSCIRTVISFGAQKQTISKYERLSAEHADLTEQRLRASSVYDALAQVLLTELIFTIALCYGILSMRGEKSGQLAALAINFLYMCVNSICIGFHLNGVNRAQQHALEMKSILDEAPLIESDMEAKKKFHASCYTNSISTNSLNNVEKPMNGLTNSPSLCKPKGKGDLQFKNVRFSYPSRPDVEVIRGINFEIKAGEHLAVVGSSGSGKSTLTALILRFYDPTSGTIYFDDENLKNKDPDDIRGQIGLVSQEPVLFDGTISDNIRYGRLDATQCDINDAARRVEAWHFISSLPEGMQTRVGDRGVQLSGGQKQRVAIARAVIRNPSLVIFDEATSALDTKHEGEVQKAIDAARQGVTTITIAHRLTTVRNADRIIVLDAGQIAEEGTYEQLMAKDDGRFYKMYMDQRLDALKGVFPQKPSITGKSSVGPFDRMVQTNLITDPEAKKRAWTRSSLGPGKNIGRSYSVRSVDRKKLALPVMSKKRTKLDQTFKANVMEVALEDDESIDDEISLPGKERSLIAVWRLIKNYKHGRSRLLISIPVTILRGLFFLLICFEISTVLEVSKCANRKCRWTVTNHELPRLVFDDGTGLTEPDGYEEQVFKIACFFTALIIIKTIFETIGRLFVALYGHGFCSFLRGEMLRKILRHGSAYFDEEKNTPGRLVHKLITDTASLNRILGEKLDMIIPAMVCAVAAIGISLWINWKLALMCGFQFPAFFAFRLIELRETSKRQRQMAEEEKKAANLATMVLTNMSTIKAYTLQAHFESIFVNALRPLKSAMKRQSVISSLVFACQFSFTYILIAITLYFGAQMMLDHEIDPFRYLAVVLLTQFGANFISQLIASVTDISKARIAAENILTVINEPAVDMDNLSDEGLRPRVVGRIALHDVEFRYPSRPIVPVLKDINITVSKGESIAIVGPSGCGKSTILALLQRMYSPTRGQVMLDNYNVRSINPSYLRRVIVAVGQEPTLFSFTIKENIAYGLCEDEATMEKIIQAAKIANIHEFIKTLPRGYDTEVGEFGHQLSGGQKQRIAIARAMVRDPVVLLLDEATAALDATSEKSVQVALESASRSCTCIHVAHRLSSIRNVDRIIVLVDGEIAEHGTHQELMEEKGLYYEMNQLEL